MHLSCLELSMLPEFACLFPSPNNGSFLSLFFQIDFQFLALLFSFWHPYDVNGRMLGVVPEAAYTTLIFLEFFLLLVVLIVFCFLMFQIIDLIISFIYSTVVSL